MRPTFWTQDEFARFVEAATQRGHRTYILDDGAEMHDYLSSISSRFALDHVQDLGLTRFGLGGDRIGKGAALFSLAEPDPSFQRP